MDIVGGAEHVHLDIALHKMHLKQAIARRKRMRSITRSSIEKQHTPKALAILRPLHPFIVASLILWMLILPANAVLINFSNCLDPLTYGVTPLEDLGSNASQKVLLQWYPEALSVTYNSVAPFYNLNLTSFGNVTGQATDGTLQPQNDTEFWNGNQTLGKIIDLNNVTFLRTTLFSRFNVLSYTPWKQDPVPFCESLSSDTRCPVAPAFNV